MLREWVFSCTIALLLAPLAHAQEPVLLQNASFEGEPGYSRIPAGWYFFGEAGQTPPDIHPHHHLYPSLPLLPPRDGHTYLGLVLREDGTSEGLGQALSRPMQAGSCYQLMLYTARPKFYLALSKSTMQLTNFNQSGRLQAMAGSEHGQPEQTLWEGPANTINDWQPIYFSFKAEKSYTHFFLKAVHNNGAAAYDGGIFIDQLSPIWPVDCETLAPVPATAAQWVGEPFSIAALNRLLGHPIFTADNQLENALLHLPNGDFLQGNPVFWQIAQWLANNPKAKARMAGPNPALWQHELHYLMKAAGASPKRYRIKRGVPLGKKWIAGDRFYLKWKP